MKKNHTYRYSGDSDASRQFWSRVNRIEGKKGMKIYSLGCKLQTMEEKVLAELEKAEGRR